MNREKYTERKQWRQSRSKRFLLLLLLLPFAHIAFSFNAHPTQALQNILVYTDSIVVDSFQLIHTFPERGVYFTVDKLQQVYLLTEDNTIIKYTSDKAEAFRYNNNTRGPVGYIDATDPFNVLLFYPDFQSIASLDRTMNERAFLLLYNSNIINASAIALARDNNIWVYDQATFNLSKINAAGEVLLSSDNLSAQLDQAPIITQMVARSNYVFLLSKEQGVFIFDNFGQFYQLLPFEGFDQMQMIDQTILLHKQGQSLIYHMERLKETFVPLPPTSIDATTTYWHSGRFYSLMNNGQLLIYSR